MASEDQGEKSEQATDTRREEFRKQGQVAHTRELGSAIILLVSAGAVYVMSRFFFHNIIEIFNYSFGADMVRMVREGNMMDAMRFSSYKAVVLIAPVFGVAFVISAASSLIQIGFLQVEEALSPNFDKLNPLEGFKKIVSLKALMEGFKSVLKLVAVAVILYFILKGEISQVPQLLSFSLEQIFQYLGSVTIKLLTAIGGLMLTLALIDYFFQRWDLEKKMMMTKQEVKEESKSREGDPMVKARIRRIQREMSSRRMMDAIPKADVVITNPTHIAVVLKYGANLPSPQIVAKGADHIAEKIKEIARQHNIPIVENKPLARTIYKTLKIGQVIPRELFVAVAEVLSYVYRLRKKKKVTR